MPKVDIEFQFMIIPGSRHQNSSNIIKHKEIDSSKYPEVAYEFIFENINEPKFDLTYLDITIKTDIDEYFIIKDYIVYNKGNLPENLKDFQTLLNIVKI